MPDTENKLNKIAIFTADTGFNLRWHLVSLAEQCPEADFTIFLHAPSRTPAKLIGNQIQNIKRHGWRWIPYQLEEILALIAGKFREAPLASTDRPGLMFTWAALKGNPRIRMDRFANINGREACDALAQLAPDLGIALGAPILKEALFAIPRLGTINLHKGKLPDYRGRPPAFWELQNGESEVGCTVHKVDAGLDTGEIVIERALAIDKYTTVAGMQMRLHRLGVELLVEAVRLIASGAETYRRQLPIGKENTRPRLAVEHKLTRKLDNLAPSQSRIKAMGKHLAFFIYSSVLMPLIHRWHGMRGRQRIVIVLYHRVSDQFRDNVTVGIERFDKHMAYLAAHYNVVSLKEIVEGKIPRHSRKPVIAVSFDDGYRDNFENAAPVLMKHQIPCTFFISTQKITENTPFPHDLKALGYGLDNMSWGQVSQMHRWGFHFGSHTMNHVNLAEASDDLAMDELAGSLNDIRTHLKQDDVYIAYPFGRKQHITNERIAQMKEVGYAACFSAYGGFNDEAMDSFNIKRVGVNWVFDIAALKARLSYWDRTA